MDRVASRARDAAARFIVAGSLGVLAIGTIGIGDLRGSAPTWPAPHTYALLAGIVAVMWLTTVVVDHDGLDRLASAALLSLALMRGLGYAWDYITEPASTNLAAVGAWGIVAGLLVHRPTPVIEVARCSHPSHD